VPNDRPGLQVEHENRHRGRQPRNGKAQSGIAEVGPAGEQPASYGAEDRSLRSAPARLEAELEERGIDHDIKVYEGAGHSFMSDHRGLIAKVNSWGPMKLGFRPEAADHSWRRVEAFFGRHLA
jgi:dienelactone hydrolase